MYQLSDSVLRLYEAAGEIRCRHKLRGNAYKAFAAGVEVLEQHLISGLDTDEEMARAVRDVCKCPECSEAVVYLVELGSLLME